MKPNDKKGNLTWDQVNELFYYDGNFLRWNHPDSYKIKPHQIAGHIVKGNNGKCRRYISVKTKWYYASRLVWFLVKRKWPKDQLDHINGDSLDDRIENLRESTPQQNSRNRKIRKNSNSGYKGVHKYPNSKKWKWVVRINTEYLAYTNDKEEGARIYDRNALLCFGEFANLNFPEEKEQRLKEIGSVRI